METRSVEANKTKAKKLLADEASRTRGGFKATAEKEPVKERAKKAKKAKEAKDPGANIEQPPPQEILRRRVQPRPISPAVSINSEEGELSDKTDMSSEEEEPPLTRRVPVKKIQPGVEEWGTPVGFLPHPDGQGKKVAANMEGQGGGFSAAVISRIRELLPMAADFPDEFLAQQSLDSLLRAAREEKAAEASKPGKKLEMRLYSNFSKAKANPKKVKSGYDNRAEILHEGRFLPGAGVKVADLWVRGRQVWGENGVEAISNYDCQALGMSGCITARGWEALHKPGSEELSIKLFSVTNVGHQGTGMKTVSVAGEDGFTIQESWKELADMSEVKMAFRNMRRAALMVRPWDFSFEVIDGFMVANNYLEADLKGFKKAQVVAGFIDHALQINAANYVQEKPFLDMAQLQALWTSWWGSRKATSLRSEEHQKGEGKKEGHEARNKQKGQGGEKGQEKRRTWNVPPYNGEQTERNTCRFYNEGKCKNNHTNCVLKTKNGPLRLYHKCNFMKKDATGKSELCGMNHIRVNEH